MNFQSLQEERSLNIWKMACAKHQSKGQKMPEISGTQSQIFLSERKVHVNQITLNSRDTHVIQKCIIK